jgi:apolipoprotein D and lipocalin family protein
MMKHDKFYTEAFVLVLSFVLLGCSTPKELNTESIPTIRTFDLNRYLGKWYEIARLPHSFEQDLDSVTATYKLREDGKVEVLNKGFNTAKGEWREAKGKAYIPDTSAGAFLKVSFFWIFYGDYKIIALDTLNYSYSMITSSSKEYLWILSRSSKLDQNVYNELIRKAGEWGFNTSKIYKVPQ